MQVEIDPAVVANQFWLKRVQEGNSLLEKMVEDFKDRTLIRWTVAAAEKGGPQLTLELAVAVGRARASFSDKDLADPHQFWFRLNETCYAAFGDGLDKKLQRIDQLLQEEAPAENAR